MICKKIFFLNVWLIISFPIQAKTFNPLLVGWYTYADYQYEDTCLQSHYEYKNLENSAKESAKKYFTDTLRQRNYCTWDRDPTLSKTHCDDYPFGEFPADKKTWDVVTKNPAYCPQHWDIHCRDKNGEVYLTDYIDVKPKFVCPEGTRYSVKYSGSTYGQIEGCYSNPKPCYSDVAGRDLNAAGLGLQNLGHIGLSDGDSVLEVLNEDPVVQNNQLEDFKEKTKYWGQKYGVKPLSLTDGFKILGEGYQQNYCDVTYTLSTHYIPCGQGKPAQFRCDSFVYYSYLAGANIDLGDYTAGPFRIFNRLEHCRFDGSGICVENIEPNMVYMKNSSSIPRSYSELSHAIKAQLNYFNTNQTELDVSMMALIKSRNIIRDKKINLIWGLAKDNKNNKDKFAYFIDNLTILNPKELIPEIIKEYKRSDDIKNKLKLLKGVELVTNNNSDSAVNDLFKKEIMSTHDQDTLKFLMTFYGAHFETHEEYETVKYKLASLQANYPKVYSAVLSDSNFWFHWLKAALNNKESDNWISEILSDLDNYQDILDDSFDLNSKVNFALVSVLKTDKTIRLNSTKRQILNKFLTSGNNKKIKVENPKILDRNYLSLMTKKNNVDQALELINK